MTAHPSPGTPDVEVLYFDGCPNHEALLPRVRTLVSEIRPDARVDLRRIESPEAAVAERFLGSPTVRVDGRDVDPRAGERRDYGLGCRLYRTGGRKLGAPPERWITDSIRRARATDPVRPRERR